MLPRRFLTGLRTLYSIVLKTRSGLTTTSNLRLLSFLLLLLLPP